MNMITGIEDKILNKEEIEIKDILDFISNNPLQQVMDLSHNVTLKFASQKFDMCSILNAKSGKCTENCKWCAQSAHYSTNIEKYQIVAQFKKSV